MVECLWLLQRFEVHRTKLCKSITNQRTQSRENVLKRNERLLLMEINWCEHIRCGDGEDDEKDNLCENE